MFHEPTELLLIRFFDRINLDPKIQIRYIDTEHQLADILTKGNFTRDEWNNLLHLFSISQPYQRLLLHHEFRLISCSIIAKSIQNQKEDERVVPTMVRKIYGRQPGDPMSDLNVNMAIWGMFMNTSLRAAVHLGKDYDKNLRFVKNYLWKTTGQLFRETEKLISGQTEITDINLINFQDFRWVSTRLLHSRAYQYSTAKVYVFSDSVLCLGKMRDNPFESWKKQIQRYSDNDYFSELSRIDGQLLEFEWKIFPGFTSMAILNEIQQMMGKLLCEPANFTGRIIFMSTFNDTPWDAKGNYELCVNNSKGIKQYARRFPRGPWSFSDPGSEKKWYGTHECKPDAAEFRRIR